ncbi:MAG: molybdopterin-dependent oxidoreductase [Sporichthyaceae bacterium]
MSSDSGARSRRAAGAWAGLVSAGVALGVAELAAALLGDGRAAPVFAIGGSVIDATPRWLKEWAIRSFGTNDKTVLVGSIVVVLVLLALLTGMLAVGNRRVGLAGVAVLSVVGAVSATTRPGADLRDALPSLLGGLGGAAALLALLRPLRARSDVDTSPTQVGPRPPPFGVSSRDRAAAYLANTDRGGASYDRRAFLLTSVGAVAVGAVAGAAGRSALTKRLDVGASRAAVVLPAPTSPAAPLPPGTDLGLPGLSPFRTSNRDFYRIDTALLVPQLSTTDWRLRVHGMVDREIELDYAALLARGVIERDVTLTCVSNEVGGSLVGSARWLGAPLADLLRDAGVRPGADQLLSRSVDGMMIGTPTEVVMDGRDALLAVAMNGEPLPTRHGFPVRMVVPGLYGYVSATKWVVDLELTRFVDTQAYWVERGWALRGPIKTMTRIDTPDGRQQLRAGRVAVAGVAWAQHRGIEQVEVRVDRGAWQQARLASVPSTDTWRQWVLAWDATPGEHVIEARATDATGTPQPQQETDPFPSGATGWPNRTVNVA